MDYWKIEEISVLQNKPKVAGGDTGYYLSTVDETRLQNLATLTDLGYHHLKTTKGLK